MGFVLSETVFINYEAGIRIIIFFTVFILLAFLELRKRVYQRVEALFKRWLHNFALSVFNIFMLRFLVPLSLIEVSLFAQSYGFGLLNQNTFLAKELVILVLLDAAVYVQHVLFHKVSFLFALHKVHHCDPDLDVSTALRFHPVEILLSFCFKALVIILLGAGVLEVIVFEVLLSAFALFNHANINIPKKIDTYLRFFIVTPDFHRVHHSVKSSQMQQNYGVCLSCWDYLFQTYSYLAKKQLQNLEIGMSCYKKSAKTLKVYWLLVLPFIKA